MDMEKTNIYDVKDIQREDLIKTLKEICAILEERGYDPLSQITGYLISGDPGYITTYKEARHKLCTIDRVDIVSVLLEAVLKWEY